MSTAPDYAHTRNAENHRQRKAHALAMAARALGMQPYELQVIGGTAEHASNRLRARRRAHLDRDPSVETWQLTIGQLEGLAHSAPGSIAGCPDCGWWVRIVTTMGGRRLAVDPFPHPLGTVLIETTKAGEAARILAGHEPRPDDVGMYRQHVTSCPQSPAVARRHAPRCSVCGKPLNAALAATDPTYTSHPCCDPREPP